MATTANLGAEGHAWSGLITSGALPERLRGSDYLSQLAFITRHNNRFLSMLSSSFPKAVIKKDRVFHSQELEEARRTFTVTVPSSDTNHQRFGISNSAAAELTENDVLYLRSTYATVNYQNMVAGQVVADGGANVGPDLNYPVGGNPTSISFARAFGKSGGTYFVDCEAVKIINVGNKDSAGTGSTEITVRRCYFGPSGTDQGFTIVGDNIVNTSIQADTTNARIQADDVLLRGLPAFKEGTGAPTGFHKMPILDNNCTQEFKYSVERTTESEIEFKNSKMIKDPMDIHRMITNRRAMLDIERTMIFGRKGMEIDSQGKKTYTTGGVIEFIPKDERHILTYEQPTLTYNGFLDIGYKILDLGGGAKRNCYIGVKLYNEFKKAMAGNEAFRFNKEDTKRFDIPIESLYVSGGELNLIPLHCMDELGWSNRMIALDQTVPSFVPVTHKNWDMKVEKDIAEKGTQIYKEQIIGMKGLERRYAEYQSIIDFGYIQVVQ